MRALTQKEAVDLWKKLISYFEKRILSKESLNHPFFNKLSMKEDDNKLIKEIPPKKL